MASEVLRCLGYLRLNVPQWTKDVDAISDRICQWQRTLTVESDTRKDSANHASISVQSSRASLWPFPDKAGAYEGSITKSKRGRFSSSRLLRFTLLDRRAGSTWSGRGDGVPRDDDCKKRLGHMYYDAELQRLFASVVRNINVGRMNVQRAKIHTRMDRLAKPSLEGPHSKPGIAVEAKEEMFNEADSRNLGGQQKDTANKQVFDDLESSLEQSQTLCERAAFQLLRDGDCGDKLEAVRRNFRKVMDLVQMQTSESWEPPPATRATTRIMMKSLSETLSSLPTTTSIAKTPESTLLGLEADDEDDENEEDEAFNARAQSFKMASSRSRISSSRMTAG